MQPKQPSSEKSSTINSLNRQTEKKLSKSQVFFISSLAMLAFAANSILCRLALAEELIDATSFTTIRIISGALVLLLITLLRKPKFNWQGNWLSAISLFIYCAGFSYAYIELSTGTGALLLFGAVQLSMLLYARYCGERLTIKQVAGLTLAITGIVLLMLPSIESPPLFSAFLMILAGVAWAIYTLKGKSTGDAINISTGNFIRASLITTVFLMLISSIEILKNQELLFYQSSGIFYAVISGALASGVGYALWYSVLPYLRAVTAASVQLTVPVIAAVSGTIFLNEPLTLTIVIASITILTGISLINSNRKK